jgi:hypothetical protein
MNFFNRLNRFTRVTLTTALVLIIYGYLCRLAGFFFFWESKSIGWVLLIISIIGFLSGRIKYKKLEGKKTVLEKIVIGFMIFFLVVQAVLVIIISNTNAFSAVKDYVYNNAQLKSEIGTVKGISIIPYGGIGVSSGRAGESGEGEINVTVKGDKKYKDLSLHVIKELQTEWQVEIR